MSSTLIVLDARADLDAAMLKLREMAAAAVPAAVMERTLEIVQTVAARGDNALVEYTRMFDWPQATVESLVIGHDELDEAFQSVDRNWLNAFRRAKDNLYRYHERQAPQTWMQDFDGMILGQYVKPSAPPIRG